MRTLTAAFLGLALFANAVLAGEQSEVDLDRRSEHDGRSIADSLLLARDPQRFRNGGFGRNRNQGGSGGGGGGAGGTAAGNGTTGAEAANNSGGATTSNPGGDDATAVGGEAGQTQNGTAAAAGNAGGGTAAAANNATAAAGTAQGGKAPPANIVDTGDPQKNLFLDPSQVAKGLALDGQQVPAANQVASATSVNNFINSCLLRTDLPLTNGNQVITGSCNAVPMGVIAAANKAPSCKFVNPKNLDVIPEKTTFTAQMAIQNLVTGNFVNAQQNYFSAPQATDNNGIIIGHSHVVIQEIENLQTTTPADPQVFAFFKGLNEAAQGGILSATVDGGLPAGTYKMSSINSASNHQPALTGVAQHGSLDDASYFIVSNDPDALAKALNIQAAAGAAGAANNATGNAGGAAAGGNQAAGGAAGGAAQSTSAAAGGNGGAAAQTTTTTTAAAAATTSTAAQQGGGGGGRGGRNGGGFFGNRGGNRNGGRGLGPRAPSSPHSHDRLDRLARSHSHVHQQKKVKAKRSGPSLLEKRLRELEMREEEW
ncbi:hypothetical protein JCM8097_001491 [Rhodosporidiobolus ruineniae]